MTPQFQTALIRASIGGVISGGLTLLTTVQQTHNWETSGIAGGVALLTYLAARGVAEGWMDSAKAAAARAIPGRT